MKSKFLKDFSALFSSRILQMGINMVMFTFLARVLGPAGMGLKSVLTNFPTMFSSFSEMGMRQSTIYYVGKNEDKQDRILSACLAMWFVSSSLGLLIYFILSHFQMPEVSSTLILISALYIPIAIGRSYVGGFLVGNDLIRMFAKFDIANAVFMLVLSVLLVWWADLGVLGYLIAIQLGAFIVLVARLFYLNRALNLTWKIRFEKELLVKMISHGVLYGVALFLSANLKQVPIFVMNGRISTHDIGIYSAGFAFAQLINNVFASMSPILFARSARSKDPVENSLKNQMLMRVTIPLLVIMAFGVTFVMKYIVPLFFGNEYVDSVPITNIMIWGVVVYNVFILLHMDMAGKGNPQIAIKALAPAFILCAILNYLSIETLGIMGAAMSTTIALAIGALTYLFLYAKEVNSSVIEVIKPRKSDWQYVTKTIGLKR